MPGCGGGDGPSRVSFDVAVVAEEPRPDVDMSSFVSGRSSNSGVAAEVWGGLFYSLVMICMLYNGRWRMGNGDWRLENGESTLDPWKAEPLKLNIFGGESLRPVPWLLG